MSTHESQSAVSAEPRVDRRPMDPVDAMLRGRNAQPSFTVWVVKRLCDLYPK